MGHKSKSVIVCLLAINFHLAICQSLEWQFDPFSTDQWFKQKLDHYDSGSIQHWPQRYVTSYRFYRLGGPIFLFLSGPGPELTLTDIENGAIAEYAEEQGAFVIGLEHRFYGKSRPTSDLSTNNLNFLTIPQTIEDIAAFVRSWRTRDEFRNSKWVVFGASYLGSLTAWFAQKHPELIDAFVASSAPLELRYEIPEFLENVGFILNETSPKCYDTVAEGFSCLTKIFNEEDCQNYTLADVKEKFNFCSDLDRTRPLDATGVFAELFSTINGVVMYHDPSPDSFPDTNLNRFCKHISAESEGKGAIDKIAEKVKEINKHREVPCAEFRFQTTVDFLREKEWDSPAAKEGYRQLQWQLCNELGWTVASANISQPFGNYLTPFLHSEICQDLFGLTETEMRLKVLKANTDLKGKGLTTKCGIYVNGNKDPWHTFSITTNEEAGQCNRAILIDGGSHGRDVEDFTNGPSHPPEVRQAQLKIAHYLDHWLKTGNCCEEDPLESKRIISSLSRPARAPNSRDYYYTFNKLRKTPNVAIRPRSHPVESRDRLQVSPTSVPYQVSTTDVLSVSPRIPVAGSILGSQERTPTGANVYRDPGNSELRRFRVVKLLRHRTPFALPTQEPSMAPSMEQFEADFPEHSIRVEGKVERVFKNGTVINSTETPSMEENEQFDLFDKGRKLLQQTVTSNEVESGTSLPSVEHKESPEEPDRKSRFRYVVKQVFKDVVGIKHTSSNTTQEKHDSSSEEANVESERGIDKNAEISQNAKQPSKREQSLEDINVQGAHPQQNSQSDSSSTSAEENESLSTSSSEQQSSVEEPNSSSSKSSEESSQETESSSPVKKRESGEMKKSFESSDDDSISTSESIERSSVKQPSTSTTGKKSNEQSIKLAQKDKDSLSKTASNKGKNDGRKEEDYYEDDYDDDDYYDDDYYDDDDDESKEDNHKNANKTKDKESKRDGNLQTSKSNSTNKATMKPEAINSKSDNLSTEFSSGENTRPRRLREKISEKIMSSSESIEGDQKSKEKATDKSHSHKKKGENKRKEVGDKDDDFEDADSSRFSSSEEDYNYSLEPSGSNVKRTYRKKQLEPLTKPVIEEPGTIINVEISGSYPKRSSHRKKIVKITETEQKDSSSETLEEKVVKKKRVRKTHRKKKGRHSNNDLKNMTDTPNRSLKATTSTSTTTTTSSTTSTTTLPDLTEQPPTNNYATWNRGKALEDFEARPVQQETPTIVSLENENSPGSAESSRNNNNNDVMYIIIGDIPTEDNPNVINDNPSHEALFNFIQKLVNRHSPGVFSPRNQLSFNAPVPPPPTTTTTTTTTVPPPLVSSRGYLDQTGKYLLVRPVQVVSLGKEHVVHANDLKNESLVDLMTMETPIRPYPYEYQPQFQNMKRQNIDHEGYGFKSPLHRDHFERLLSVDGQVRDSDRDYGYYRSNNVRRLDQIPDPSWRSIRGVSQFGPAIPPLKSNPMSGLLSLTAADTRWVDEGVPFLPRGKQISNKNHRTFNRK